MCIFDEYDEPSERCMQNPMDIKDMCAKEAKERADAFLKVRENEDFKNIMYLITDAAENGKYKIYLDDGCNITLTDVIKDKLEQLGYKVEVQLVLNVVYQIIISWKGEKEDEQ